MRFIQSVPEEEMVALFLRTEICSERWRESVERLLESEQIPRTVIEQPNTEDAAANAQRAHLLGAWRGYRRNEDVFDDMPDDIQWWRATLSQADLARLKYIIYDYWTDLSGGSRFVIDAAKRMVTGDLPDVHIDYQALAGALEQGAQFPELILLYNPAADELVILEGHVRATAHAIHQLTSPNAPSELITLVGCSDQIQK